MTPEPLSTLLDGPEFRTAVAFGFAGLIAGMGVAVTWRAAGRRGTPPVIGILVVTAGTLAVREPVAPAPGQLLDDPSLPGGLVVALAVLFVAGMVADSARWPIGVGALLALPGAFLLATRAGVVEVTWIRVAAGAAALAGGWMVASFDRRWEGQGVAPAMLALSAVGVYFTVPDTEEAMVLLGVSAPIALLGWPLCLARIGTGGSFAVMGLLSWTVAEGGYGRHSSIVGGLACVGLFAVEPLVGLAARVDGWRRSRSPLVPLGVMALHLALVFVASRVAGLRLTVPAALAIVAAELVVAAGVLASLSRALRAPAEGSLVTQGAVATERQA